MVHSSKGTFLTVSKEQIQDRGEGILSQTCWWGVGFPPWLPFCRLVLETLFHPRFRLIVTTLINIGPTILTFGGLILVSGSRLWPFCVNKWWDVHSQEAFFEVRKRKGDEVNETP